jgi:hypothetical protein
MLCFILGLRSIENIDRVSSQLERLNLSENCIVDIRPLGKISSLKYINLSENEISDVNGLVYLSQLESLDLRCNKVSSIEAFQCLSKLSNFHELNLIGNHICTSIGYPSTVYMSLPNLRCLDGQSREFPANLQFDNDIRSADIVSRNRNHNSSLELRPNVEDISTSESTVTYLKSQLESMEHAFELQDTALSDVCKDCEVNNDVPYLVVLQLWRRKAIDALTKLSVANHAIAKQSSELKAHRAESSKQLKEAQMNALSWKERASAALDKTQAFDEMCSTLRETLHDEQKKRLLAETNALVSEKAVQKLKMFLENCVSDVQEKSIASMFAIERATAKLEAQKDRLAAASDRISFSAALVAQKEVQLRNTIAVQGVSIRSGMISKDDYDSDTENYPAEISGTSAANELIDLRPEAEALLRTIFRRLDTSNSGVVSCELLLTCMDADGASSESRSDNESLAILIRDVLGKDLYKNAMSGLQMNQKGDITWGEFLSLLPGFHEERRAKLFNEEIVEFERFGAWGDLQYGMIPLDLSSVSKINSNVSSKRYNDSDELQRLSNERAALLRIVQQLTRTMERRAETLKAHYLDQTRNIHLQLSRVQTQYTTIQDKLQSNEIKFVESSKRYTSEKELQQSRLQTVEHELNIVRKQLVEAKATKDSLQESMVILEKDKYERIQEEYELMQKELSRKDFLTKGLERDVRRMTGSVEELSDEKCKMESELAACERQLEKMKLNHEADLIKLKHDSESVKNSLQVKLNEAEMKLKEVAAEKDSQKDDISAKLIPESVNKKDGVVEALDDRVVEDLRTEMDKLRQLQNQNTRSESANFQSGQGSVYAAHLEKLLRLAEEAISGHSD